MLADSPTFVARFEEMRRARVATAFVTREEERPLVGGSTTVSLDGSQVLVRWRGAPGETIEAFCSKQLDLESKAPDPRGVLRAEIKQMLAQMIDRPGMHLHSTFIATALLPRSDVENVLFTNVDAYSGPFAHLARRGVNFEFWPETPPTLQRLPLLVHCSVYEQAPPDRPSRKWNASSVVAEWRRTSVPSLPSAGRCATVWWAMRHGDLIVHSSQDRPAHFGVHLVLHVPPGTVVNTAAKLKVVVDAAVLALCSEDGRSDAEGMRKFAEAAGKPLSAVRALLVDSSCALLGPCATVTRSGQANPLDSGCVQGSLTVQEDPDGWALSGQVVALQSQR